MTDEFVFDDVFLSNISIERKEKCLSLNDVFVVNPIPVANHIYKGTVIAIKTKFVKEFPLFSPVYFHGLYATLLNIKYKDQLILHIEYVELFTTEYDLYDNLDIEEYNKQREEKLNFQPTQTNRGRKVNPITMVNGRLSDAGFAYFNKKLEELVSQDPEPNQMKYALWRARKEFRQSNFSGEDKIKEILDFCATEYNVNRADLEDRNNSRLRFWGYAKRM